MNKPSCPLHNTPLNCKDNSLKGKGVCPVGGMMWKYEAIQYVGDEVDEYGQPTTIKNWWVTLHHYE